MKAFVSIQDFGSDDQKRELCEAIARTTMLPALINGANVVVECDIAKLGAFFTLLAANTATNWIEYTVQFDA